MRVPVCVRARAARTRARCALWRAPRRAAGESQAKPHTSPSLSVTFVQYYMLDRMDSTSNAHSIEPAPGTGDESRDRAELRCTRSSRSRTGEAHRTRTAQVQAGHTAAAQRSARNEARPCIYLRRSGGSRAVRSYTPPLPRQLGTRLKLSAATTHQPSVSQR